MELSSFNHKNMFKLTYLNSNNTMGQSSSNVVSLLEQHTDVNIHMSNVRDNEPIPICKFNYIE